MSRRSYDPLTISGTAAPSRRFVACRTARQAARDGCSLIKHDPTSRSTSPRASNETTTRTASSPNPSTALIASTRSWTLFCDARWSARAVASAAHRSRPCGESAPSAVPTKSLPGCQATAIRAAQRWSGSCCTSNPSSLTRSRGVRTVSAVGFGITAWIALVGGGSRSTSSGGRLRGHRTTASYGASVRRRGRRRPPIQLRQTCGVGKGSARASRARTESPERRWDARGITPEARITRGGPRRKHNPTSRYPSDSWGHTSAR